MVKVKPGKNIKVSSYSLGPYVGNFESISFDLEEGVINYIGDVTLQFYDRGEKGFFERFSEQTKVPTGFTLVTPSRGAGVSVYIEDNEKQTIIDAIKIYSDIFKKFDVVSNIPEKRKENAPMLYF